MSYRPKEPFATPVDLYNPTTTTVKGVTVKTWAKVDTIFCTIKSYLGTDSTSNDQLVVYDTAHVETWFRPDIKSNSQIRLGAKIYEIIGEPEDIELRHQFMKFRVQAVKGGA